MTDWPADAPKPEAIRTHALRPDDIVVIRYGFPLNSQQRDRAREILGPWFEGHRVIVLDSGAEVEVMRPEPEAAKGRAQG